MRLTVHVTGARKTTDQVKTKDGMKTIRRTFTTLSYYNVEERDVAGILTQVEEEGKGTPVKHYLSN